MHSVLATLLASGLALAQRPAAPQLPDAHGYLVVDQASPSCGFQWVDIAAGSIPVDWTASGSAPAMDDGGAVVALAAPFELYGESASVLVLSSNGYLSLAPSLAVEDGGDFSNDAMLPAIPDNAAGVPARMLAYHDDLSGFDTGGAAYHQHFPGCPRPSEALGSESCTVFQWVDWAAASGGDSFDFQIVAYHQSFQIVFQVRPGTAALSGGTMGIQNLQATAALQYRPESALTADSALCFFEPRYPPGGPTADLEITKTHKPDTPLPAQTVSYSIGVLNRGPSPVSEAEVDDLVPPTLTECSWSCSASDGSSCAPAGSGSITDLVDLQPGGWADYVLWCSIGSTGAQIVNTATVAGPVGWTDPQTGNNSAEDLLATVAGRLPAALTVERVGGQLLLQWGSSCRSTDADYAVYAGVLGSFGSHEPIACTAGGGASQVFTLPPVDTYYLVVPNNLTFEGSYGLDGNGLERPPSPSACFPQSTAPCP